MNKVMLIGNVGKEPEMTYTPSGSAVTKFTLATNRRWTDKQSGEKKEETTWFNIVAWDRQAETISQYVHKGSKIYIEGRFTSREYTDKDGVQRRVFDVIVSEMELLDSKGSGQPGAAAVPAGPGEVSGEDFPF
jgi:single-strand DNA-binding protein